MKKMIAVAAAAAAFVSVAATVVHYPNPQSGNPFRISQGGKLVEVDAFTTAASGTVDVKSVYSAPTYTNAVLISEVTNEFYTVVSSNDFTHIVSTNLFITRSFESSPDVIGVSTNRIIRATTNIVPFVSGVVTVTNDVASGTASGNVLRKKLDSAVYIGPNEPLIFTGTATGGWLRFIFE